MKITKFTKLAALLLTVALMFGVIVGVSAFAADGADEGSATVISKNVDHGTELALCFAVSTEGTVDGDLYVLVWDWNYSGDYTFETAQQKKSAVKDITVNETACKLFIADSVAAKDLDEKITYRTCIVKADGSCVYGAVASYSVLDYTAQRLTEIPTSNLTDAEKAIQIKVCNALIEYNAKVEAVLQPDED